MKTSRVEIEIDDNRAYTQVAFLVDIPAFLDDVEKIRNKYKLKTPFDFGNIDSLRNHLAEILGYTVQDIKNSDKQKAQDSSLISKINFSKKKKMEKGLEKYRKFQDSKNNRLEKIENRVSKMEDKLTDEMEQIRRKYQFPAMFDTVVHQAVFYNKITGFKTATTWFFEWPPRSYEAKDTVAQRDHHMVIVVTPYSLERDVLEALRECRTKIRKHVERFSPVYHMIGKDTFTNIRRNRDWHWKQLNGEKYNLILDEWNNMCPYFKKNEQHPNGKKCKYCDLIEQNAIEQAVSRYRKNLQFPKN